MTVPHWHEEPIAKKHRRDAFDCGDAAMNDFFRNHARKSHESGGAKTFLAVSDEDVILGFYSVSPASIEYARTPAIVARKLARHDVPVFRLARLAVHVPWQGHGLGGQLLLMAARRCIHAADAVGGVAMLIDAKNDRAAAWYESYGAIPLDDAPQSLVLPLAIARVVLTAARQL